jgi:UDP-N-acetyl-D-galactosamine dehydrogenase
MISNRIAVIGLGYVGLPLARLFATKYPVVGFDINQSRINGLLSGTDSTLEISDEVLQAVLLDKNHVTMIAFPKFKKRINE